MSRPWQPIEASVADTGLHYLKAGSGHPIILLHGWAACKEIWWYTLQMLAPNYHAIAFEWPGHGRSPAIPSVSSLADLAELVAQSCTALGLHQVTIVGHSMGGRVAALLALNYPELVTRLVLVGAALDPAHIAPYARLMLNLRRVERTVALHRYLGRGLEWLLAPASHNQPGGLLRSFLRRAHYHGLADPQALHRYVTALYADSLDQHLPDIHQPTLIISGERDPLVLPRQAYRAAECIPNARLHIIPRAFHAPMDERPDEFGRVLLDFLNTTPPIYGRSPT
jgi:pimeloyl-ACP methyl ester carboxylesterase